MRLLRTAVVCDTGTSEGATAETRNSWGLFRGSCLCHFPEPSISSQQECPCDALQHKVGLRVPLPSQLLETLLPLPLGPALAARCCWQRERCCSAGHGAGRGHWEAKTGTRMETHLVLREAKQGKVTKTRLV